MNSKLKSPQGRGDSAKKSGFSQAQYTTNCIDSTTRKAVKKPPAQAFCPKARVEQIRASAGCLAAKVVFEGICDAVADAPPVATLEEALAAIPRHQMKMLLHLAGPDPRLQELYKQIAAGMALAFSVEVRS